MNTPCMYCYDTAERCAAEEPRGFVCTRGTGHDGDHAACDGDDHPIATWPQRGDTTGEALSRLWAELRRLLDEADVELRAQARCPDPDEHVRYDAALAAAEKAERERDEARGALRARLGVRAESRPLTPDAITDEMVKRGRTAYPHGSDDLIRAVLTAALTEPPKRPEGAEDIEAAFETWEHAEYLSGGIDADDKRALADHIAEEMNR